MTVSLGNNISSTRLQRQLSNRTISLRNRLERVTSGSRLNKGSDDAAGQSIADVLKSNVSVFRRAIANLNDGISAMNIVDNAFREMSNILVRQIELAQRAANGVYNPNQRIPIHQEAEALTKEFNRIVATTTFNGLKLLNGDLDEGLLIQGGYGLAESYLLQLGAGTATTTSVGDGTFNATSSPLASSQRPTGSAIADFNNDGFNDLLLNKSQNGKFVVYLNAGDGTFPTSLEPNSGTDPTGVAVGDFNNDGFTDIVSSNSGSNDGVTVQLGFGNGTFSGGGGIGTGLPSATEPAAIAVTQLNGGSDSFADVITANGGNGTVSVMLGNGTGTFGSITNYAVGGTPSDIEFGDLFGNGTQDFIVATGGSIVYGEGAGGTAFGGLTSLSTGTNLSSVALADFNNDGRVDILGGGTTNGNVYYFENTGAGFAPATAIAIGGGRVDDLSVGDFNGDGLVDIVSVATGPDDAFIGLNDGSGGFSAVNNLNTGVGGSSTNSVSVGDLNGDGVLDLVTSNFNGASSNVFFGNPGTSSSTSTVELNFYVDDIDLRNQVTARQSLDELQRRLNQVNFERGRVGALSQKLEIGIANLQTRVQNLSEARSRITDADIAVETAGAVKDAIGEEISSAVLSQANQSPKVAVELITTA